MIKLLQCTSSESEIMENIAGVEKLNKIQLL